MLQPSLLVLLSTAAWFRCQVKCTADCVFSAFQSKVCELCKLLVDSISDHFLHGLFLALKGETITNHSGCPHTTFSAAFGCPHVIKLQLAVSKAPP
jgi:hypothetical protein